MHGSHSLPLHSCIFHPGASASPCFRAPKCSLSLVITTLSPLPIFKFKVCFSVGWTEKKTQKHCLSSFPALFLPSLCFSVIYYPLTFCPYIQHFQVCIQLILLHCLSFPSVPAVCVLSYWTQSFQYLKHYIWPSPIFPTLQCWLCCNEIWTYNFSCSDFLSPKHIQHCYRFCSKDWFPILSLQLGQGYINLFQLFHCVLWAICVNLYLICM